MKLVLKISTRMLLDEQIVTSLTQTISRLLSDGHRVLVVHGTTSESTGLNLHPAKSCVGCDTVRTGSHAFAVGVSRSFLAALGVRRIAAFGLWGTDGNIFRLRTANIASSEASIAEVASVESYWLDVISAAGGVPVLASVGLGPDRSCYRVDPSMAAAQCAVAWNADALILIVCGQGVCGRDGKVFRWLAWDRIEDLVRKHGLSCKTQSKLEACKWAIQRGVRRARIFPAADISSISQFYFCKIDSGTEIVLSPDSGFETEPSTKETCLS